MTYSYLQDAVNVEVEGLVDEATGWRCVHPVGVNATWRAVRVRAADHDVLLRVQAVVPLQQVLDNLSVNTKCSTCCTCTAGTRQLPKSPRYTSR